MEIHLGEPKLFSEVEVKAGISFARSKFGFELDKRFLLYTADYVLGKTKRDPSLKFKDVLKEALLEIRFQERYAYASTIGKMFSDRSNTHRLNRHHRHAA